MPLPLRSMSPPPLLSIPPPPRTADSGAVTLTDGTMVVFFFVWVSSFSLEMFIAFTSRHVVTLLRCV